MDTPHSDIRRQAIGTTIAATPLLRDLRDQAAARLAAGESREQVRAWLCEKAVDDPLIGLRPFLGINRKLGRASAGQLIRGIGEHLQKLVNKKRVQDLLTDWAHTSQVDAWLADYILGWVDTGEPPGIAETNVQLVSKVSIGPKGDKTVIVFATCNALSDPKEVARAFIEECARTFPSETFSRRGEAEEHARRFRLFAEGLSDTEIARQELTAQGFALRAATDKEFASEVQTRANSVLKSRGRWLKYVTNLVEPVSPDSE